MSDALLAQFQRLIEEIRFLRDLQGLPTILTKKRAARELGVSLSKLKGLIRTGEVATCKVGSSTMVPASEVQRIAASAAPAADSRPGRARGRAARKAAPRAKVSEAERIRAALRRPR